MNKTLLVVILLILAAGVLLSIGWVIGTQLQAKNGQVAIDCLNGSDNACKFFHAEQTVSAWEEKAEEVQSHLSTAEAVRNELREVYESEKKTPTP